MWWNNKHNAFALADSMVALFIIVMATTWFLLVESQLAMEHRQSLEKLSAARLAKEAADQYQLNKAPQTITRDNFTAHATVHSVTVLRSGRVLLEVRG